MRDAEWDEFCSDSCDSGRPRILAAAKHFCDEGERDLPGSCFRWLSRTDRAQGASRQGAFQAGGVVLRGHANDRVFFVTSVEIDPVLPPSPTRRRGARGEVDQRQLPLALIVSHGGKDGQDR